MSKDIVLREARLEDYINICDLNKYGLGYEYPLEKTRERLEYILSRPSDRIFIAENNNEVVGYIHGSDYECTYSDPLKNIMAIVVRDDCRGKGVGRMLIRSVENWAKSDNCIGVRLVSGYDREKAHEFYLHCGYCHRKNQKNFVKLFEKAY